MDFKTIQYDMFSGISKAYIEDADFRNEFFGRDFRLDEDVLKKAEEISKIDYDRNTIADALKQINISYNASEQTLQNIDKLRDKDCLCVVTGQQAGIFGGPLYTLYKAATTIKMAKKYSKMLSRDVVPVFWIASEDHDFEEIRKLSLLDDDKIKTFKMDKKSGWANKNPYKDRFNYRELQEAAGCIDVNESLFNISESVATAISPLKHADWAKEVFVDSLSQNDSIVDWFGKIYARIFADEGLIIIDPMNPEIRGLGTTFLPHVLEHSDEIMNGVRNRADKLQQLGYRPMIELRDNITGLYIFKDGERKTLFKDEHGDFYSRHLEDRMTYKKEDLIHEISSVPENFSTNVVLRPVIQDVYLPTLAYVAGPGELSYYAQLSDVYKVCGKTMPLLIPRENYTYRIAEHKRLMVEHDIGLEDVLSAKLFELQRNVLKRHEHVDISRVFLEFEQKITRLHGCLTDTISDVSEELDSLSKQNLVQIRRQIDYLKNKTYRFHRKDNRDKIEFLEPIYNVLRPNGNLQERSICVVDLLARAGNDIVRMLVDGCEYSVSHRMIDIE